MFTLHQIKEGFIVTSCKKQQVELEKLYYESDNNTPIYSFTKETLLEQYYLHEVIAQQEQIDFSNLSEEEQKEIGWYNVEKLATEYANKELNEEYTSKAGNFYGFSSSYIEGFNKAQELLSDKQYTFSDMKKCWENGNKYHRGSMIESSQFTFEKTIQSLSQPKSFNIEGEWIGDKFKITKLC